MARLRAYLVVGVKRLRKRWVEGQYSGEGLSAWGRKPTQ
jgi:hypothetical protein